MGRDGSLEISAAPRKADAGSGFVTGAGGVSALPSRGLKAIARGRRLLAVSDDI